MYIKRHMESAIKKNADMFGAVLVTGARQIGKTTLLKEVSQDISYISLDDPILLRSAREEAGTFFKDNPPPVFIDEIQYAPNLFRYIKMLVDTTKKNGLFFLSGSQQFKMMKNVSESLAGRLGILNLPGLSLREICGVDCNRAFLPTDEYFAERRDNAKTAPYKDIWKIIWRGCMPKLCADPSYDWGMYYGAYVKTYIERDVRDLAQVGDELKFVQFMTLMAARTGQLLNLSAVSREVGISAPTAERWLYILAASNIIYLLMPYYNNITKRAVKTPKLYFLDTGLAAYLTRWTTPEVLQNGAMAGAFFETFVIAEIIKSYYNQGWLDVPVYFYRDKEGCEIDLIIEQDGGLYPIEIKKYADPQREDIKAFGAIDRISGVTRKPGGIICMYDNLITLKGEDRVIPVNFL